MRIISGKFGGRNIIAPSSLPVRPTTDFAKTGLFNILANHFDFENISVLDLFTGTGNISFEFASRGTEEITCVDGDQRCVRFIKEFQDKLNLKSIDVIRSDVFAFLKRCEKQFDIIFADPPFEYDDTDLLPDLIQEKKMLKPNGWLIVEHQSKRTLRSKVQPIQVRKYGNCSFLFMIFLIEAKRSYQEYKIRIFVFNLIYHYVYFYFSNAGAFPPWIYQSNRKFSAAEIETISEKTKQFLESWTAHNQMLKASFEIRYDLFLILMIDEKTAGASGCSIDKSVHFIQSLEQEFNLSLLNRMLFAVKKNDAMEVLSKNDFEKQLSNGELNDNTIVFNNLVQTKEELATKWEVPMKESWHKKVKSE